MLSFKRRRYAGLLFGATQQAVQNPESCEHIQEPSAYQFLLFPSHSDNAAGHRIASKPRMSG